MFSTLLSSNLFRTLYALFLHNYPVLVYLAGFCLTLFFEFKKPSRPRLFSLLGFLLLIFHFEYEKHISAALTEQTLTSLGTTSLNPQIENQTTFFLTRFLPLSIYFSAWLCLFLALFLPRSAKKSSRN